MFFRNDDNERDELYDVCMALRDDLRRANDRVRVLEDELAKAKMERSRAVAHESVMRRNIRLTRGHVIPHGDIEEGYRCPVPGCGAFVHFPFEQRHCMCCGVEFDWSPTDDCGAIA